MQGPVQLPALKATCRMTVVHLFELWLVPCCRRKSPTWRPLEACDSSTSTLHKLACPVSSGVHFRLQLGLAAIASGPRSTLQKDLDAFVVYYGMKRERKFAGHFNYLVEPCPDLYYYYSYLLSSKWGQASAISAGPKLWDTKSSGRILSSSTLSYLVKANNKNFHY